MTENMLPGRRRALVLSGGLALGAYQAGACEALLREEGAPAHIAATSVGAVNAVLIAGCRDGDPAAALRAFWRGAAGWPLPFWQEMAGWRQGIGIADALQSQAWGRPGLFRRRLMPEAGGVPGLHDLTPLRDRLAELVDFGRIAAGGIRLSLSATDLASGERVVFDTARGDTIGPEQVAASSALVPLFAPLEIDGRWLGDGALSANTPLDLVLDAEPDQDLLCFLVDLFAPDGQVPRSLGAGLSRSLDLVFGNQTRALLQARQRDAALRAVIARMGEAVPATLRDEPALHGLLAEGHTARHLLLSLGFHAGPQEIGVGKLMDYSAAALRERWQGGAAQMRAALRLAAAPPAGAQEPGLTVLDVPPEAA